MADGWQGDESLREYQLDAAALRTDEPPEPHKGPWVRRKSAVAIMAPFINVRTGRRVMRPYL